MHNNVKHFIYLFLIESEKRKVEKGKKEKLCENPV